MARVRHRLAAALAACAVLTGAGCGLLQGPERRDDGPPPTTPSGKCTDIMSSDPWIAFEPSLQPVAEMEVGGKGWTTIVTDPAKVTLTGESQAVELLDMRAPTRIECGEVKSSISWLEVRAKAPGRVTLSFEGSDKTIAITVR